MSLAMSWRITGADVDEDDAAFAGAHRRSASKVVGDLDDEEEEHRDTVASHHRLVLVEVLVTAQSRAIRGTTARRLRGSPRHAGAWARRRSSPRLGPLMSARTTAICSLTSHLGQGCRLSRAQLASLRMISAPVGIG